MVPDFTLSFWPGELSEEDAELQERIVHLHFDAKYKADNIGSIFGDETRTGNRTMKPSC